MSASVKQIHDYRRGDSLPRLAPDLKYISVKEYATLFGVTVRTAYTWVRSNPAEHNARKVQGVWRVLVRV